MFVYGIRVATKAIKFQKAHSQSNTHKYKALSIYWYYNGFDGNLLGNVSHVFPQPGKQRHQQNL